MPRTTVTRSGHAGRRRDPSDLVAVGRIGKAHGVRGDVFVEPWTDTPEERFAPGAVLTTDPAERGPLTVAGSRDHSGKLVVHFDGVDDRNAVEAMRGTVLLMPAAARPVIEDPDEFYDTDLIGLSVRTVGGLALGPVTDVLHSPAGSLLAIDVAGREVLLPFRLEFVPGRRPGRRDRRGRPAGRAARPVTGCWVRRHRPDASTSSRSFPDYLAPLRRIAAGPGDRARPGPARRARPAPLDRPTCTAPSTTPRTAAARAW